MSKHDRENYPTILLAGSDSLAFRQCLWIDFVFGTPEAQRAIAGLWLELIGGHGAAFILSPQSHEQFCMWVGIAETDNTRRGPFARWLEDAGLAIPVLDRARNATSVIVELKGGEYATPEAVTYSLLREFADPFSGAGLHAVAIDIARLHESQTQKSLFIADQDLILVVQRCIQMGYLNLAGNILNLDPSTFALALRSQSPFPAPNWIDPELSPDVAVDRAVLDELQRFPDDETTATAGSVFDQDITYANVKRRTRDIAFPARIGAAYKFRCCFSGFAFRSPNGRKWYGHAAHIVPHEGKDRNGVSVHGSSVVANGIFLAHFMHWCFDNGWITLIPVQKRGELKNYKISAASIAADEVFKAEAKLLLDLDDKPLIVDRLPDNRAMWPSLTALEWHRSNVFLG